MGDDDTDASLDVEEPADGWDSLLAARPDSNGSSTTTTPGDPPPRSDDQSNDAETVAAAPPPADPGGVPWAPIVVGGVLLVIAAPRIVPVLRGVFAKRAG